MITRCARERACRRGGAVTVVVRPASSRSVESHGGIVTRRALAGGAHYDPDDVTFGRLVAHDEHELAPGAGFDWHPHRGLVIVTWVVRGQLTHRHRTPGGPLWTRDVRAGQLAYLVTGAGVEHAERNDTDQPVVFVQSWLLAGTADQPAYGLAENYGFAAQYADGDARVVVTRPAAGQQVRLARQPFVHAYVASGRFAYAERELGPGDVLRAWDEAAVLTAQERGDVVAWSMTSGITPPR